MGIRVLVIEDEPEIADFIVRGLREESFVVEHRRDAESAWAAMRSTSWDVALLDWWLPGQDGLALLKRYREEGCTNPILFLTARDAVSDRVRALDAGADDYLCKPFAFEELLARVRALARRGRPTSEAILKYSDLVLNLATQRVERGGARLTLTAKEYALLVLFMRHAEQILTRTRIYEHLWNEPYDGTSNTLEFHIMELRRKLEAHGPRLLHTYRGRGYCLSTATA
jgi:two-component system, OmpR family, copper resistance phosphate regulon response regulator CusR